MSMFSPSGPNTCPMCSKALMKHCYDSKCEWQKCSNCNVIFEKSGRCRYANEIVEGTHRLTSDPEPNKVRQEPAGIETLICPSCGDGGYYGPKGSIITIHCLATTCDLFRCRSCGAWGTAFTRAIPPKRWHDGPSTLVPLDVEALEAQFEDNDG